MAIVRVMFLAAVTAFLLAAFPASAETVWRDCFRKREGFARMLFFQHSDLLQIVDPKRITLCEYGKVKEGTMASVILERPSQLGSLEREFLTPILARIAGEYDYHVRGHPLLSTAPRSLTYAPYVHDLVPEDPDAKRYTFLTGARIMHRGGTHRLVMVFRGQTLTDAELQRLLLDVISRLSI